MRVAAVQSWPELYVQASEIAWATWVKSASCLINTGALPPSSK